MTEPDLAIEPIDTSRLQAYNFIAMKGQIISHYRIIEKLGEGGMGVVYKAEDLKLGRTVALKFLSKTFLPNAVSRERFVQEARAAASLNHPHICTVHEIGEEDGDSFIAMEYVEGKSLDRLISERPLKLHKAVEIAIQIAEGLGEAHDREIVHRDIKPGNIMLDPKERVKIMDFGLARSPGSPQLTKEGTTVGTVSYMAPEQASGDKVDNRSDIWSLGTIIYEMITGRRPFNGEYDQAVIYAIMNADIEPPTGLRSGVPMELERIVLKCLSRDPGERYQTASDLAADLRRVKKSILQGSSAGVRAFKQRRLNPAWSIPIFIIVLAAAYFIFRATRVDEERNPSAGRAGKTRIAVLPFENLGSPEDDYFADGISEEITSRLAAIRELGVISRKSALYYKGTDKTISDIGRELDVDYVLEGTVRWEKLGGADRVRVTPQLIRVEDDSHVWAENMEEDFGSIFELQARIAEKVARELDIALTGTDAAAIDSRPTDNMIAYQLYLKGADHIVYGHRPESSYRSAEMLLEEAVSIDPGFALAWAKLSHAHRGLYFYGYDRTPERLALAKQAIDRAMELDPDNPGVRRELGFYYYQGLLDYDRALEEFNFVAKVLPDDAEALEDIAYIWRRRGEFERALETQEIAFSMSPKDAGLCIELANTFAGLKMFREAYQYTDSAIGMAPENHWGYFLKAVCLVCDKGDIAAAKRTMETCPVQDSGVCIWIWYYLEKLDGKYEAALAHLDRLQEEVIRTQDVFLPVSLAKGVIYDLQGEHGKALKAYSESLAILKDAILSSPDDPRIMSSLGRTYAGLGIKDDAIKWGRKAIETYPVTRDAMLGTSRMRDMALIYTKIGESKAAIDMIREILDFGGLFTLTMFEIDPSYDSLREDPAYIELVAEFSDKLQ